MRLYWLRVDLVDGSSKMIKVANYKFQIKALEMFFMRFLEKIFVISFGEFLVC